MKRPKSLRWARLFLAKGRSRTERVTGTLDAALGAYEKCAPRREGDVGAKAGCPQHRHQWERTCPRQCLRVPELLHAMGRVKLEATTTCSAAAW